MWYNEYRGDTNILKRRFARDDIDAKEYQEKKAELEKKQAL
jgi:uncharacterized membrane protein